MVQWDQQHLQHWDVGSILGLAQWVKDLALLPLGHRSQLRLRSDHGPGNAVRPKNKTNKKKKHCYEN